MKLATEIWRGFNPGYAPVQKLAVEEFALQDYCNNFTTWGTCWAETGESDGPAAGDIQIQNQELRVKNNNKGVARGVNLEGVVEAWLSFNWRRESLDNSNDYVSLDISPNDGGTWYNLDRFKGDADDYGMHRGYYYNITPYANANTRIRLLSSRDLGGSDKVYFDNLEVVGWSEAKQSIDLHQGFNLVSVNIPMGAVTPTAFALLNSIGPETTVASLQRFNPTTGRFETATYLNVQPMGVNFLIHPSEAYVVHLNQPASSPGFSHLQKGFNLATAAIESKSVNMTAFALLRAIGDATVVSSIQRFNPTTGQFEVARYENNQPVGVDFPIDPGEGYIIYMQQDRPGFRP